MKTADPFEAFWAAYPRRRPNPKAAARKEWQLALRKAGVTAAEIVAAAVRFAAEMRELGTAPQFVPQARNWLKQERFRDYPAEAEATPAEHASAPSATPEDRLRAAIGEAAYNSWFARCALTVDAVGLTVKAPSRFTAEFIVRQFLPALRSAWGVAVVVILVEGAPL